MNNLAELNIENFKSFTNRNIIFNDITCFVGPNESGKTNLLEAIYHLSADKQMQAFTPGELRLGAPGYPDGEIRIKYRIRISREITGKLLDIFPQLEGRFIVLTKKGKPKVQPIWEYSSDFAQNLIPDICQILDRKAFDKNVGSSNIPEEIKRIYDIGWFYTGVWVDFRKNPYWFLHTKKKIVLLRGKEKINFICEQLKNIILKNIKIYFWKYDENAYLKESISISELILNPENFRSVTNMFIISGWKKEEFALKLQNQNTTIYDNLLLPVKRDIDSLIKNHWTTHKKLMIDLKHDGGDRLIIHLIEPGSSTPPEYRSDGLKWFLTFLINFRALSTTISNYILLIDEPGLHLHPRGQKDVLEELENLSDKNQIIYTTHQTFLINKNNPERVRIVNRSTQRSGGLSSNPFFASQVTNVVDTKNILTDALLREALGFKVSDISPINEENILVEGVFDREVLYIVNESLKILDLNKVSIIACGKASNIAKHASLYQGNGLKVVCLYDSDEGGKASARSNSVVSDNKKRQIRDFERRAIFETTEDLLPDNVFNSALGKWFVKWGITPTSITRPRMYNLEPLLIPDDKKIEMKHNLEDYLVSEMREHIKSSLSDYTIFESVLNELKTRVNL